MALAEWTPEEFAFEDFKKYVRRPRGQVKRKSSGSLSDHRSHHPYKEVADNGDNSFSTVVVKTQIAKRSNVNLT